MTFAGKVSASSGIEQLYLEQAEQGGNGNFGNACENLYCIELFV